MTAEGRASGKIILLGEHAVVYGCPAIATGISLGAWATARIAPESDFDLDIVLDTSREHELKRAFAALRQSLGAPPVAVTARTDIPAGLGLGASAALGVAVARAVATIGLQLPESELRARVTSAAQSWEAVFHGRPSGIDVAAATLGDCFEFTTGHGPKPIHLATTLPIAVGVAGPPMSTKIMVDGLARLRQEKPELVDRSFDAIRSLVSNAKLALENGDLGTFGHLLDLNQMLLAGLFLSSAAIERACAIARAAGALGAKLTGKGGGGCVIALCPSDPQPILDAWRRNGIEGFITSIQASARA